MHAANDSPPSTTPAATRLSGRFADILGSIEPQKTSQPADREALTPVFGALQDYVSELRVRGEPPERVLVSVKDLLQQVPMPTDRSALDTEKAELVNRIVGKCICEYYIDD